MRMKRAERSEREEAVPVSSTRTATAATVWRILDELSWRVREQRIAQSDASAIVSALKRSCFAAEPSLSPPGANSVESLLREDGFQRRQDVIAQLVEKLRRG
jgi:hypothetical protein